MMDGHMVYQGLARDSVGHFDKMGFYCPNRANPADYFMKITNVNYPKQIEDEVQI